MDERTEGVSPWLLLDWDRELLKTNSWQELECLIRRLPTHASCSNAICNLVSPLGHTLSFGIALSNTKDNPSLSTPMACVNYQSSSGDPPYLAVVGNDTLDLASAGVVVFRYENGEWTEVSSRNCVSVETLLRVVRYFFDCQLLPDWIAWEEV